MVERTKKKHNSDQLGVKSNWRSPSCPVPLLGQLLGGARLGVAGFFRAFPVDLVDLVDLVGLVDLQRTSLKTTRNLSHTWNPEPFRYIGSFPRTQPNKHLEMLMASRSVIPVEWRVDSP